MNERIKVLHIIGALNMGGAETMVMNIFRNIDRSRFQFDFYLSGNSGGYYEDEAKQLGARIINVGRRKKNPLKYCLSLFKLIRKEKYDVIQVHATDAQDGLPALVAKVAGAKKICLFSHNSSGQSYNRQKLMQKLFMWCVTDCQACSDKAADWMFGKNAVKAQIIPLPIDCKGCKYDYTYAMKRRKELNLENAKIIGHIGRFQTQKNHVRMINIFAEIARRDPRYHLVLIGDGILRREIEAAVITNKLEGRVTFLGTVDKAYRELSIFDLFLLPSLYEGFPTVLLEAQANGLPCIAADSITQSINLTCLVSFVSLEKCDSAWADKIDNKICMRGNADICYDTINKTYNAKKVSQIFENIYLESRIVNGDIIL